MSDAEPPPEAPGGPSWRRPAGGPLSPAVPPSTPKVSAPQGRTTLEEELYQRRLSRHATSALPHLVVAFVLIAAAWWAMDWSAITAGATEPVRSSEWWTNLTSLLLPGEDIRLGSYSQERMWVTMAVLVLAAAAVFSWIGRLGRNLRSNQQPFGSFLPLLAFPGWWILPISLGLSTGAARTNDDQLLRFLVAFGILFGQFLLVRWPLLNRIWRAGGLPFDLLSIVLWLPMMIPWLLYFASTIYTYIVVGDGKLSESGWRPTSTMLDLARGATRATGLATLVLLVVVTIMQQIGLAKEKAATEEERDYAPAPTLPTLPPRA